MLWEEGAHFQEKQEALHHIRLHAFHRASHERAAGGAHC